jgi:undecaprenyl-diphosphatase
MLSTILQQLDISLFRLVNQLPHPLALVYVAKIIHYATRGALLYLPIVVWLVYKKPYRRFGWLVLVTGISTIALTDWVLKLLVHRPRPFDVLNYGNFVTSLPSTFSFPSSQTAMAAALVMLCVLMYKNPRRHWLWLWVIIVGLDRVYMGHHYPSDVLAGAVVGILLAYWAAKSLPFGKRQ